jgi:hypothetical protein
MERALKNQIVCLCLCLMGGTGTLFGGSKIYFKHAQKQLGRTIKQAYRERSYREIEILGVKYVVEFNSTSDGLVHGVVENSGGAQGQSRQVLIEKKIGEGFKLVFESGASPITLEKNKLKSTISETTNHFFHSDKMEEYNPLIATARDKNALLEKRQQAMRELSCLVASPDIPKKPIKEEIKAFVRHFGWELNICAYATYFYMDEEEAERLQNAIPELNFYDFTSNSHDGRIPGTKATPLSKGLTRFVDGTSFKKIQADVVLVEPEFFPSGQSPHRNALEWNNGMVWNSDTLMEMWTLKLLALKNSSSPHQEKLEKLKNLLTEVQNYIQYLKNSGVQELLQIFNSFRDIGIAFTKLYEAVAAGQMAAKIPLLLSDLKKLAAKIEECENTQ